MFVAKRMTALLLGLGFILATLPVASAGGPTDPQNDAGTGQDAPGSRTNAPLLQPGTYAGSIGWFDESDWYAFEMGPNSTVCVDYANAGGWSSFTPGVYPYDAQGRSVATVRGCAEEYYSWSFASAGGGRYYVNVRASLLLLPGDYAFALTVSPLPELPLPPPPPPVPPLPSPTLLRVDPARGASGASFTLYGHEFQSGAKALFDGAEAPLEVNRAWSTHQATGVVPPLDPGTYNVTLVNPDGQLATLSAAFEVTLAADPGFLAGDLVITRRPVQVEGQAPQSTPFDMRRVTVTVRNLGFGPTTEPVWLTVNAEPDGRMVPAGTGVRTIGSRLLPAAIGAGDDLTVLIAWDTKGYLGDYVVRARLSPVGPQLSGLNDEIAVEHTVAVSGLGGI